MKFVLFTKTPWSEAPRIRHQVAGMLLRRGHDVVFFEKNRWIGPAHRTSEGRLELRRHGELLHHQMRVVPFLAYLNARYECEAIRRGGGVPDGAIVLNFNYDYGFLRSVAPTNTIITIINDDFVAAAKWFSRHAAERELRSTLRASDHTLAVSFALVSQIERMTGSVSLFLPWARMPYTRPESGLKRREMLCWGFIDRRLDVPILVDLLDRGIVINFVGPVTYASGLRAVLNHRNARYYAEAKLSDIPDVVRRCACSILPYDRSNAALLATTISNRAFDLLSVGLPLLYSRLPYLLPAPAEVITVCDTADDFAVGLEKASTSFDRRQGVIREFLVGHDEEARYVELARVIDRVRGREFLRDENWRGG